MSFVTGDAVYETITTPPGTGTPTLVGAVTGYRAMSAVATVNGDTFYYVMRAGSNWEVGLGTRASSTTFTRTAANVLAGSAGVGVLVNFSSGTTEFWMDIPARMVCNLQTLNNEITGLHLSNSGADATNDIVIASGWAADSTNLDKMFLEVASIIKQTDAAWAVGTNAGGRDTGSTANGTWHVWLIKRPDTGVVDVLFSLSATAPTMPANYTLKRRIGSILRESAAVVMFWQNGNLFRRAWSGPDVSKVAATGPVLSTFKVPTGISVQPLLDIQITAPPGNTDSDTVTVGIGDARDTGGVAYQTVGAVFGPDAFGNSTAFGGSFTNTSAQLIVVVTTSAAITSADITATGWIDTRGREGEG